MERLIGTFEVESRGLIDVKGKGPTAAYLLVHGPRASKVGHLEAARTE